MIHSRIHIFMHKINKFEVLGFIFLLLMICIFKLLYYKLWAIRMVEFHSLKQMIKYPNYSKIKLLRQFFKAKT